MNPFEMVVLIVAIVMIASVFRSRYQHRSVDADTSRPSLEAEQLRDEVRALKERVQTLERITVEKENSLAREIEDLRSRP